MPRQSFRILIVDQDAIRASLICEGLAEAGQRDVRRRAKAFLMRARALSEDKAHALIRSSAMRQDRKRGEVARWRRSTMFSGRGDGLDRPSREAIQRSSRRPTLAGDDVRTATPGSTPLHVP